MATTCRGGLAPAASFTLRIAVVKRRVIAVRSRTNRRACGSRTRSARGGRSPLAAAARVLAACLVLLSAACDRPHLRVAPEVEAAASPDVLARVRADPYNYFRLTNHEWTARVCEIFAADLAGQPIVQLHGDAHVEQFALMNGAWGLDDFDDSSRGPALVDIVRFLGSIDLATRKRGWTSERQRLFNRFFDGYRRALANPAYRPPEPGIVKQLQNDTPPRSHVAFLAWAEAQMQPMADTASRGLVAAMQIFSGVVRAEHPDLREGYFRIVRAGWLQLGMGSAGNLKVLMRIAGPSDNDPGDDVLLEAKALRSRGTLPCLEAPASQPTFRIVQGIQQVGRLKHAILVAGPEGALPEMTIQGQHLRDWWIRSWDPSYREVALSDLRTVGDLSEIVHDSGAQLGASMVRDAMNDVPLRERLLASLVRGEARQRRTAQKLVHELLRGWRDLGGRAIRETSQTPPRDGSLY